MGHQDNAGKFIAFILRHHPEAIGMKLDEHGWARTEDLIAGIAKSRPFDMQMLEEIVRTDSKQRYSFNEDKTLIRANQGHSIPVDVELEQKTPPDVLWHGTGEKYVESINRIGLIPKSRLYVHLSKDYEDCQNSGEPTWKAGCIPGKCKANGRRWLSVLFIGKWGMADQRSACTVFKHFIKTFCSKEYKTEMRGSLDGTSTSLFYYSVFL